MVRISPGQYPKKPVELDRLSLKFMKQFKFVPICMHDNTLIIAAEDPSNSYIVQALKYAYHMEIEICEGSGEDIVSAIERLYGTGTQTFETIIEEADRDISVFEEKEADANYLRDLASEAPIIRLVNHLILNAIEMKASDIHFEPYENIFKVRYRIDGILHDVESPPRRLQSAIISRVKIISKLDIAERRLPQDGRVKLRIIDRDIDFRVSTIPTLYGESVVMRILDRETLILDLQHIGFPSDFLSDYMELIRQPYGMILVTGPTGSGKTSTLYTTLTKINSSEKKIITLEDPVEYQLEGMNQIQVNPKIGLSFANGLRSILRQDPDVILVGEIRDKETAEIAVQSALTGHLLFSTLHTNDSIGAIMRLLDMDVEGFLLGSTLLGVLAQRLVRVICPHCKEETVPEEKLIKAMLSSTLLQGETAEGVIRKVKFYQGRGCEACRFTGFKGRTGIFEFLPIDDNIRSAISANSSAEHIKKIASSAGYITLRQDGWKKILNGVTTVSEVLRVTLEM